MENQNSSEVVEKKEDDLSQWSFRAVLGPAKAGPRDAYDGGLAWSNPRGDGMNLLIQKGSEVKSMTWPNRDIGRAMLGMHHDTRVVQGEQLVAAIARLAPALERLYGKSLSAPVEGAALADPRWVLKPADIKTEEKKVEEKPPEPKKEEERVAPPPPPEPVKSQDAPPAPIMQPTVGQLTEGGGTTPLLTAVINAAEAVAEEQKKEGGP